MNKLMNLLPASGASWSRRLRLGVVLVSIIVLAGCNSTATREAEQAAAEQARVAAEQQAARVAAEDARARAAAEELARQERLEEQSRLEEERRRQAELARQEAQERAEQERLVRQEAEQRQRAEELRVQRQREAIARAESEREQKLARIEELEAQIASMQASVSQSEDANAIYQEAILVAEELVDVLAQEQAKYENQDEAGNLLEPLAKDRIEALEQRKNQLVEQARTTAN